MKLVTPEERANARRDAIPAGRLPVSKTSKLYNPNAHYTGIIESNLASYVHLKCGHITHKDEIILLSCFRPSNDKYWCGKCGKWGPKEPPPVYEIPDEPMF